MDETMQKHADTMVAAEIAKGYRIKVVPDNIVELLEFARQENDRIPVWKKIRFEKLNPRAKALVGETTAARFNEDFQSKKYLTRDEIRKIAIERGAWTEAEEHRIEELSTKSTQEMQALYLEGFDKRQEWLNDLGQYSDKYLKAVEASAHPAEIKEKVPHVFDRWLSYQAAKQDEWTRRYAADQGSDRYNADRDFVWLIELAESDEIADALMEAEVIKRKLQRLMDIIDMRNELDKLQAKQRQLFSESIESRRDRVTELAQIYYGTKHLSEEGKPLGRLLPTFEDMWDLPDGVIEWIMMEAYFFYEGVPDYVKEYLEAWGFMPAERETGSSQPSEESPVPQNGNSDSSGVEKTLASSSTSVPVST